MINKILAYMKQLFKKEEIVPLRNKTYVSSKFGGWDIQIERVK
jgi:hypothetical protein